MNIDHELDKAMKHQLITLGALLCVAGCATPSAQHSTQAANNSGQAIGHSVATVGTGAALISAAPLTAVGNTLTISGAALADAAYGADEVDYDPTLAADGPPTLK